MFGRLPAIAAGIVQGGLEVLMTAVWSRGHFQIGWFDDVDAVINLDAAREAGIDVFRRPLFGGGTAFYDTDAAALWSWIARDDRYPTLDDALRAFKPAMERVLSDLGLGDATFEGAADIRWNGRKLGSSITNAVLGTKVVGGFLNLKRPDLDLYRRVARVPEEKFKDKIIKDAVAYICTPDDVRGTPLGYEEFRDAVVRATGEVMGFELEAQGFTREEDAVTQQFVDSVSADPWIKRISSERFHREAPDGTRVGFANLKSKKLVRAGVALHDDDTIAAAMIAGDMHISPPDAIDRAAAALAGAAVSDREDLVARIRAVFDEIHAVQADDAAGVTPEDMVECVLVAAKAARA